MPSSISSFSDNYYGSILDPIHGDIKLSEIEKWCIGQPIFSRLRKVKQNTFLYYVFPSANHTRFEHSIGVMHIAGKIFESCNENYATGRKKREKYEQREQSSFYDLSMLGTKLTEVYYQELRLAALLHDIGHGPMSHLFDNFSIDTESFLSLIKNDTVLQKYHDSFKKLIGPKERVEHEVISCALIFHLICKLKEINIIDTHKFSSSASILIELLSAERIVQMIEPKIDGMIDMIKGEDGISYKLFFSQIVTAFPIDADRMDYLLRDSYFSGVTYGIYDVNRIFSSFQSHINDQKEVGLSFKESGIDSILRFIQSRSHLYNQVYFHKTNRSANTMLTYCTNTYSKKGEILLSSQRTIDDLIAFYTKNSDEIFLNVTVKKKMLITANEKMVHEKLLKRKLFKRVLQEKIILFGQKKNETLKIIDNIVTSINAKLPS